MSVDIRPYWRSAGLRLTLLAATVFAVSAGLVLSYAYGSAATAIARQTDRALRVEMDALMAAYKASGVNGLNKAVVERSLAGTDYAYVLAYPDGSRISGQPDRLPEVAQRAEKSIRFDYEIASNVETGLGAGSGDDGPGLAERRRARGYVLELPGGYRVMTWKDVAEDERALRSLTGQAWTIIAMVLLLAGASGAILSQRFIRRVDALNAVAHGVMAGDLGRRAPRTASGDELDTLSGNLNAMLDRIEHLMTAMRHAGDSIAHDLRSPLTRLRARLETALADDTADRDEALRDAIAGADEVLATFNAVLNLARLQAGERRAALVDVDLASLARDLGELYEPACEDAGVAFALEADETLMVRGDPTLIGQAVTNLLDNAVKYTPAGGAVTFRARLCRSGERELSVTDTGPGIPESQRERVRQRFVRLDESRSAPGAGLGLALVQAVVELHAGRLELDDGPGSTSGTGSGLRAALVFPDPAATRRAAGSSTSTTVAAKVAAT